MPARRLASPSRAAPGDSRFDLLRSLDKFAELRSMLSAIGQETGEWAGVPMPLDDQQLVIEPTYPYADFLKKLEKQPDNTPLPDNIKFRGGFWSTRHRMRVLIYEEDGIAKHQFLPGMMRATMELGTLGASLAWGIEQEHNALQLLGTLVRHHSFKHYLLTGMFLETSKRSGLTYLFRKLRPTLVLDVRTGPGRDDKHGRVLCALCMHPIGFYAGTWAGALCPTDDVIAHLMLMRADEPMLWRKSNQHSPLRPEAGL